MTKRPTYLKRELDLRRRVDVSVDGPRIREIHTLNSFYGSVDFLKETLNGYPGEAEVSLEAEGGCSCGSSYCYCDPAEANLTFTWFRPLNDEEQSIWADIMVKDAKNKLIDNDMKKEKEAKAKEAQLKKEQKEYERLKRKFEGRKPKQGVDPS